MEIPDVTFFSSVPSNSLKAVAEVARQSLFPTSVEM